MSFKQKYLIKTFEICLIVFFIWFTFYGGFLIGSHFDEGWYISEDGYNFIDSAKLFKGKGLEVFVKSDLARQASLNYIFTIILISFLIELENWAYIFLGINLTLYLLSYYILKNFLKRITQRFDFFYLNIILIFFYFSNYENYFYVRLILSDCIFTFLVLLIFVKFNEKRNLFNNIIFLVSVFLIFFVNPKFITIIFFLIFYQLIKYLILKNKLVSIRYFGTSIIFAYLFGLFLWSAIYTYSNIINNFEGDIFIEIKKFYLDGAIIYNRKYSDYLLNEISVIKIFYLGILRSFYFFQFWVNDWDLKHNIVNLISIFPLYLSNLLNIYNFEKYSKLNKKIVISIIAFVIAFVFTSSITAVDYDWRIRFPLYVIFIIGLSVFTIENKFKLFRARS
tara:strand:- start:188 stop:1366 length:1179 start_codon:yes stop_codon:yes gene_type:complete